MSVLMVFRKMLEDKGMKKQSKNRLRLSLLLIIISLVLTVLPVLAHDKVVVVPLGGKAPVRIFYGSVNPNGYLETGNAVSGTRVSVGSYRIDFGEPTAGCAVTVTKGLQNGGFTNIAGNINAHAPALTLGGENMIDVRTYDGGFLPNDAEFHFTAICPP
jgi:hypothetical protein